MFYTAINTPKINHLPILKKNFQRSIVFDWQTSFERPTFSANQKRFKKPSIHRCPITTQIMRSGREHQLKQLADFAVLSMCVCLEFDPWFDHTETADRLISLKATGKNDLGHRIMKYWSFVFSRRIKNKLALWSSRWADSNSLNMTS